MEMIIRENNGLNKSIPANFPRSYRSQIQMFENIGIESQEAIREFILSKKKNSSRENAKQALKKWIIFKKGATITDIEKAVINETFKNIKIGKADKKVYKAEILSEIEIKKLTDHSDKKKAIVIETLYQTGLRISELVNIEMVNCQIIGNHVLIELKKTKGNKERTIKISVELFNRIKSIFESENFLFQNGKRNYTDRQFRRYVSDHSESIIGRRIHPHILRHCFATHTIHRTGKIKAVSEYLGHSKPAITLEMYVHEELTTDDLMI